MLRSTLLAIILAVAAHGQTIVIPTTPVAAADTVGSLGLPSSTGPLDAAELAKQQQALVQQQQAQLIQQQRLAAQGGNPQPLAQVEDSTAATPVPATTQQPAPVPAPPTTPPAPVTYNCVGGTFQNSTWINGVFTNATLVGGTTWVPGVCLGGNFVASTAPVMNGSLTTGQTTTTTATTVPVANGTWTPATLTWYGPGDELSSYNPVSTGLGNCIQNAKASFQGDSLQRYAKYYAGVNDQGPLFGGGACMPNPGDPRYPICSNQKNCGRCYELRCTNARGSKCSDKTTVVLMVDACPADAPGQKELQAKYGHNGCIDAAKTNTNHFDVSPVALGELRVGQDGEIDIEFREVAC